MGLEIPDFVGKLRAPRLRHVEPATFTREEVAAALELSRSHSYLCLPVHVIAFTGMDVGDMRALSWAQVDLRKREIRWERIKTGIPVAAPIHPNLRAVLMETPSKKRRGLVCRGIPASPSSLQKALIRMLTRAEVSEAPKGQRGWRRFRHTYATRLVESGATLPDVRALMGHHPTSTVTLRYFHSDPSRLRDAVERAFD